MWEKFVEQGRSQMKIIIRCMRIVCWVPKATNTHCRVAFPLQQWLQQRALQ